MKEINIGSIILKKRRESRITQEELAKYLSVTRASVSKWENGQSYPDIVLLPRLAKFFNISIDELIDYEPQMDKLERKRVHSELIREVSSESFRDTLEKCIEISKEYYSCLPLLLQIGNFLINHAYLSKDEEIKREAIEYARKLFIRVKGETKDIELVKQAIELEGASLLMLKKAEEVLELLLPLQSTQSIAESLIISAYSILGRVEDADRMAQTTIYQGVINLLSTMIMYLEQSLKSPEKFEETVNRIENIVEAFNIKEIHPWILTSFYISAAKGYNLIGDSDTALNFLEDYSKTVNRNFNMNELRGDEYFNLIDSWIEETLILGKSGLKNEALVRKDFEDMVKLNPAFMNLRENNRYIRVLKELSKSNNTIK